MKHIYGLCLFLSLAALLFGQRENWKVASPGGYYPTEFCFVGSDVWVTSDAGIMRWNTVTDLRTQYNKYNTPGTMGSMYSVCDDGAGQIWAGGSDGALRFDGEDWQHYNSDNSGLPNDKVRKIIRDTTGAMWFATDHGVARYAEGQWSTFTHENSALPGNYNVYDFDADQNGGVWLCSAHDLYHFDGSNWEFVQYANGSQTMPEIESMAFDTFGNGWFVFYDGLLKKAGDQWYYHTTYQDYDLTGYYNIWADNLGGVWLAKWNSLLHIPHDGAVEHYSSADFAGYNVGFKNLKMDMAGRIWIGMFDTYSPQSLVCFESGTVTQYPICATPIPSPYVTEIFTGYDHKLWLATSEDKGNGGFLSIDDSGAVDCYGMYNIPMLCDHVWSLAQDTQHNLWIGGCLHLLKWSPTESESFTATQTGISASFINTICPVGDGVWIGNFDGVSRYADGVWAVLTSAEAGISLDNTTVIKADGEGRIWLGCADGLLCCQDGDFTAFNNINNINDIAFGPDGDVWVAHGYLSHLEDGVWTHYTPAHSPLIDADCRTVAVDHNNLVWVATTFPDAKMFSFDGVQWLGFDATNSPLDELVINTIYVDQNNTKWIGGKNLYMYNENGIPLASDDPIIPPAMTALAYPNPFKTEVSLRFDKASSGPLELTVYNLKGQKVHYRNYPSLPLGQQEIAWDGRDDNGSNCASGLYLIRVREQGRNQVYKALKLK